MVSGRIMNVHGRWYGSVAFVGIAIVATVLTALAVDGFADSWATRIDGLVDAGPERYYAGPEFLGGWVHFDAAWYRSIARHGYYFEGTRAQSSVAFFPLYPLLMRGLQRAFGGDPAAWGVLVTVVSGFGTATLLWRWLRHRMRVSAARTAVLVLLLWPYALYLYGAAYADALFVFLVLAAFTCVERENLPLAAVLGALATATRPVGIVVVLGLTARVLERRGVVQFAPGEPRRALATVTAPTGGRLEGSDEPDRPRWAPRVDLRRLQPRDLLVLLSATGLLGYMTYLWRRFDDPFAFATAEGAPGWNQKPGPRVWFKASWFDRLVHLPSSGVRYFATISLQAVLVLGLVLLVPRVVRRFGWAYGVYTFGLLAFPLLGSKDFQGLGRYALGAFPAFAVLGEVLDGHPRVRRWSLGCSAAAMLFITWWFGRGGYVA